MNESLQAFDIVADMFSSNPKACSMLGLRCGVKRKQFDAERFRKCSNRRKIIAGNAALACYQKHTGEKGPIDFDKFRQWCNDHPKLVAAAIAAKCILFVVLFFI